MLSENSCERGANTSHDRLFGLSGLFCEVAARCIRGLWVQLYMVVRFSCSSRAGHNLSSSHRCCYCQSTSGKRGRFSVAPVAFDADKMELEKTLKKSKPSVQGFAVAMVGYSHNHHLRCSRVELIFTTNLVWRRSGTVQNVRLLSCVT